MRFAFGITNFRNRLPGLLVGTSNGVSNSIKNFAIGFSNCSSGSDYIIVGIGTSNCNLGGAVSGSTCSGSGPSDTWIRGHGAAWAQMVNGVGSWITQNGYGNRVQVRGAFDMEPSWSTPGKADLWIHGYDFDGSNIYPYLANYSADGCERTRIYNSTANVGCVNGFDLFWMRHLTEGHQSLEFPQVYYGVNAIQWLRIEEYSNHGTTGSLFFLGALGSPGTDNNTAHKAHQALWTELNQPSPASAHNPNHAAQAVANASLALGLGAGFHDH